MRLKGELTGDEDLLGRLKAGEPRLLRECYLRYQDAFMGFITRTFRCTREHAREIYPECVGIMYFNIQHGRLKLPLQSTLQTYLNAIGRYVYLRRYKDKFHTSTDPMPDSADYLVSDVSADAYYEKKEQARMLEQLLKRLGDPCATLLRQVYYENTAYAALSEVYKESENTLRKRKHDCLKKLRALIADEQIEI